MIDEPIKCEYCQKEVEATKDMKSWLSVSEVKAEEEDHIGYFCSYECLGAWVRESDAMYITRLDEQCKDRKWREEEKKKEV
jgi:hypothetical protein